MFILGISCYFHDSAACILKDGVVVAAACEERFTRIKHDNAFPKRAIEYCLNSLGIAMNELEVVAFYEKPVVKFERILSQHLHYFPRSFKTFIDTMTPWLSVKLNLSKVLRDECHYHGKLVYFDHHLCHAASAYYLSHFKKSVIVTIDGVGEWATTTVGLATEGKIHIDKQINFPHSLGLFYSAMTAYLGFAVNNDEYKVMGLAAYGDPKPFQEQMAQLVKEFQDGSFQLDMQYFDFGWADHMPNRRLAKLLGHPTRALDAKMLSHYEDIAASTQEKLEKAVMTLLHVAHQSYKVDNLCLAGGVALNSVLNGKILARTPFKKIYIPPDPSDAGGAMGAAFCAASSLGITPLQAKNKTFLPYLGPGFTASQIKAALENSNLTYRYYKLETLLDRVSNLLIKQKVVGWFQGRMEWGPRALGNRSILASATHERMRDIINAKVKHREMFRPFAPVILQEYVQDYFQADAWLSPSAKYMLMVYPFKAKGKREVPATVHVDDSGRLQTLAREDNPKYYDLIERYRQKTGTPIIINTSFNIKGEPIVCTPYDAINCFLGTEIDYLVMDNYLVSKN